MSHFGAADHNAVDNDQMAWPQQPVIDPSTSGVSYNNSMLMGLYPHHHQQQQQQQQPAYGAPYAQPPTQQMRYQQASGGYLPQMFASSLQSQMGYGSAPKGPGPPCVGPNSSHMMGLGARMMGAASQQPGGNGGASMGVKDANPMGVPPQIMMDIYRRQMQQNMAAAYNGGYPSSQMQTPSGYGHMQTSQQVYGQQHNNHQSHVVMPNLMQQARRAHMMSPGIDSLRAPLTSTHPNHSQVIKRARKPPPRSHSNIVTQPDQLPPARPGRPALATTRRNSTVDDEVDWNDDLLDEDDDDDDYNPSGRGKKSSRGRGRPPKVKPRLTADSGESSVTTMPVRASRRSAQTKNWGWLGGGEGPEEVSVSSCRASRKRPAPTETDADWVAGVGGETSNDEVLSSGAEDDLSNVAPAVKRKREASPAQAATYEDVDEDEDLYPRKKQEPCILDTPSVMGPAIPGVDKVVNHKDCYVYLETGEEAEGEGEGIALVRRYLVKWVGRSQLHNEWWSYEDLQVLGTQGIKKVSNYIKKQDDLEKRKSFMSEDEIEQLTIALELQKQLDADALIAERIVTHTVVKAPAEVPLDGGPSSELGLSPLTNVSANGIPSSTVGNDKPAEEKSIRVYLVKWTSCAYDQCTWETYDFLAEHKFEHLIGAYENRESRMHGPRSSDKPLNQHDLSETSFEPYTQTPAFLSSPEKRMELRDYQLTGLNWIISRMKKDLSVLLADEMGLGKTAQTISVVGHMLYEEKVAGPFLIVVPQSTMDNWLAEFTQWLPECNVILYHGNPQAREIVRREEMKVVQAAPMTKRAFDSFVQPRSRLTSMSTQSLKQLIANRVRYRCDVVVTTPSILQCPDDLTHLRSVPWYFMAVDEAHQLKNRESKRFKELCLFKPRYKLLLSGTPLHNNLEELWSLLHFMNPTIYNSLPYFQSKYSEVEKTDSVGELKTRQLTQLQKELSEVVLRRVKKDVLKSLPNKVEWILRVELSPRQSALCKDVVLRNYESLSKSTGGSKLSLQNICVELKKICNHPFLLHCPEDRETFNRELLWASGKMCLLDKLLARLKAKGHRVLIFSQMVRMLNLLSTFLTLRGFKHQRLDGTMSRDVRKKAMDHFNAPGSDDFCFLLSTKAGGLGINLTSADTVIIYDSDWNPQNDLQAEARAHRIGQTKTVQIYRVVTKDSVEEDILERAKAKMVLDALVVQGLNVKAGIRDSDLLNGGGPGTQKNSAFSRDELSKILKFGATKLWTNKLDKVAAPTSGEDGLKIDLDRVLAEAEEHGTGSSGRAADLLSSFSNVSDFRYEAPKAKDEDKLSWDSVVPLQDRLKFKPETVKAELPTSRNRKTTSSARSKRSREHAMASLTDPADLEDFALPDLDYEESDEEGSDAPKGRRRIFGARRRPTKSTTSNKSGVSKVGSTTKKRPGLGDREKYRLSRAMNKYGSPATRFKDVVEDAKLQKIDQQLVLDEAASLLARCEAELERLQQEPEKKAATVNLNLGAGYACPCKELVDKVYALDCLHRVILTQNPDVAEPWTLDSRTLQLEIDDPALKPGDTQLLKGIYLHGFANWQKIGADAGLAEQATDFAKKVRSDKIKIRANKVLLALTNALPNILDSQSEKGDVAARSQDDSEATELQSRQDPSPDASTNTQSKMDAQEEDDEEDELLDSAEEDNGPKIPKKKRLVESEDQLSGNVSPVNEELVSPEAESSLPSPAMAPVEEEREVAMAAVSEQEGTEDSYHGDVGVLEEAEKAEDGEEAEEGEVGEE